MKYMFTEVALAYKNLKIMINQVSYWQKQKEGKISMYERRLSLHMKQIIIIYSKYKR
jgi:hypothetical protein